TWPPPVFDPPGARVAVQCASATVPVGCQSAVIDLSSGVVHDVPGQSTGPLSWLPEGELLTGSSGVPGLRALTAWDGSTFIPTSLPDASWALASPSGAVALVTEAADETNTTRIIDASGAVLVEEPGIPLSWSADGSALAIRADSGQTLTLVSLR
ncbi:MAG: hypothetical protein ACRDGI_04645, partial [Candidatus Limnocylindrales bacterium]